MKIAVMSDIHGNINALEAVLADATEKGAEEFWNLGNIVSFGAFHEEVVSALSEDSFFSTVGAYDMKVMDGASKARKLKKRDITKKGKRLGFIKKHLSGSARKFIESLPDRRSLVIEGKTVLAVHGSVEPLLASINANIPMDEFSGIMQVLNTDIILCWVPGESFVKESEGRLFVNPGSVGLSDDGNSKASYAMLEISGGRISAVLNRVEYDVEATVVESIERGAPDIYSELLFSGRRKAAGIRKAVHDDYIKAAKSLAVRNLWDDEHSMQVMMNAVDIFNGLSELHGFGEKELVILKSACILHDIGINRGVQGHHKKSMKIILKSSLRPFSVIERNMIALIARYHRKALPSKKHEIYSSLEISEKHAVDVLSAIIRVADGLDRTHQNIVEKISCNVHPEIIELICRFKGNADKEIEYGLKKSDLMKSIFGRDVIIRQEAEDEKLTGKTGYPGVCESGHQPDESGEPEYKSELQPDNIINQQADQGANHEMMDINPDQEEQPEDDSGQGEKSE